MSESELMNRVTLDPGVCHGKPCIRGLRYPIEFILEMLSGPTTPSQFLHEYPDLQEDDLKAAFAYAAKKSRTKSFETLRA